LPPFVRTPLAIYIVVVSYCATSVTVPALACTTEVSSSYPFPPLAPVLKDHADHLLRSWTCGLPPMYSPLTALTLTAYLLTRTATRLPMLTDRLTYAY
jgi:hypothetical protein